MKELTIDHDNKNETINDKIEAFCSVLKEMPTFPRFVIIFEGKKLELVESDIISNLFFDLEGKNKFTDDQDVYNKTESYCQILKIKPRIKQDEDVTQTPHEDVTQTPQSFDEYQSKFKEMTNYKFLKKFIKQMIDLNKLFRAMPKWKRICLAFLGFVPTVSGIVWLLYGISAGSKLTCFIGILVMCAWAGLICSLVFHLSLALLIPSAIILVLTTICVSIKIVQSQVQIYEVRQEKGTDIDDFFNLVGEINQYLDTHDFPPKKISSGEQIFDKSQINEKIKNVDMNKENNVTIEEDDNKKSKKGKNK